MLAIATLLIVVLLSLLVTRVAAVALVLTGMSPDVARFQARSALTSTGFATAESEQVMGHPARRRIVFSLMLLGNAGLVTTIASLSQTFATSGGSGETLRRLGVLIGGLVALLLLARSRRVQATSTRAIERLLRRYTSLDVRDYAALLHVGPHYGVDRIRVRDAHWLAGRRLADARLSDEGVLVLGVERADGVYLGAPRGTTTVEAGDRVLVYGPTAQLAELLARPSGAAGAAAHDRAVAASERREAEERAADRRGRPRGGS